MDLSINAMERFLKVADVAMCLRADAVRHDAERHTGTDHADSGIVFRCVVARLTKVA
jgi:hypothetical protein